MSLDVNTLISLLYQDEEIKTFCLKNRLSNEQIIDNLSKFMIQKENNLICRKCEGASCAMDPYGMKTKLIYTEGKLELVYYRCPLLKDIDSSNIDLSFFTERPEYLTSELYLNDKRARALQYIMSFENEYHKGKFTKGIYFYGSFGVGKTYLMFRLAHNLSRKGVKVFFSYYPDLVRFLKSAIASNELEATINKLKYAEVLMLDDVGAESNTAFIRDEVLGPILQYRIQANLPVCMTSNYNMQELKEHFRESKQETDILNGDRIYERIKYLMKECKIDDKNYRM
jgi:primosomal protein DnaI